MLSPQWLDQLRSRTSLSTLIGRTTRLQKAGREYKACCPFHEEKTPSFHVNDEKGFYHCFGCGAHGDAIRWMTDHQGLAFMDAVKDLAAEAGMDVPAPDPGAARAAEKRDSLHDVMAAAQEWFVASLAAPEGAEARAYLATRGFDAHTVQRFGFGYAPDGRQALKNSLSRFPEPMLIEAGLRIVVDDKEPYDRFRSRLTLPIEDNRGRVIAFGGRILAKGKTDAPKYLNSPDTPLFDKGRTLYNLHRAAPAARQSGRIIVVEGYMDVIALAAAGIAECVAPMGTALTEHQLEMLWRQVENPILCFDGDAAGQRAAMRAITRALPMLRPAHSLRIVRLPEGLDPDDLLKAKGRTAMEAMLDDARSLVDVLWEAEHAAVSLATPEAKAGLKARLLAHVEAIGHPDVAGLYKRDLMDRYSAFAFPPREERPFTPKRAANRPKRDRNGNFPTERLPSDPKSIARLNRATDGNRDALSSAIIAGLVRWPAQIHRHAETLMSTHGLDPRFEVLIDCCDSARALESGALGAILAQHGLELPGPGAWSDLRFGFLQPNVEAAQAATELAQAIELLVERPALEVALANATARCKSELSDEALTEAWLEQQRLLKRKLEFDNRLRQMATRHAASS